MLWKKKKNSEKRKAKRLNWEDCTNLFTPEGVSNITVLDISAGGVKFLTDKILPNDTIFKIKINYNPIDFPLSLKVVRHRATEPGGFEHGAIFVDTPPEGMTLLHDHLDGIREQLKQCRLKD